MLMIQGTLLGVFQKPEFINRETGEVQQAKNVLQISHETRTKDGQRKFEQIDLTFTGDANKFQPFMGKEIHVDVIASTAKDSFQIFYQLVGIHGKATAN